MPTLVIWAKHNVPDGGSYPANRIYIRDGDADLPDGFIGGSLKFTSLPTGSALIVGTAYTIVDISNDATGYYIEVSGAPAYNHHEDVYYYSTNLLYPIWNNTPSGSGTGIELTTATIIETPTELQRVVGVCGQIEITLETPETVSSVSVCGQIDIIITSGIVAPNFGIASVCGQIEISIEERVAIGLKSTVNICGQIEISILEPIFNDRQNVKVESVSICGQIDVCVETVDRVAYINYTKEVTCGLVTMDLTSNTDFLISGETVSRVMVDFGDGIKKEYTSLANASMTHTYTDNGYFTVKTAIETNYIIKTGYNKIYIDCLTDIDCSDNLFDVAFYAKPKTSFAYYDCDTLTKEQWVECFTTFIPTLTRSTCDMPCPNCGEVHLNPGQCSTALQVCLRIDAIADTGSLNLGEVINYSIFVYNDCCDDATNVSVTESIPQGYLNSISVEAGMATIGVVGGNDVITWTGLIVPANGFIELKWNGTLFAAPTSSLTTTSCVVSLDQTIEETLPLCDTVTIGTNSEVAVLTITKTGVANYLATLTITKTGEVTT